MLYILIFYRIPPLLQQLQKNREIQGHFDYLIYIRTDLTSNRLFSVLLRMKNTVRYPLFLWLNHTKKAEKLFRQTGCDAVMIGRAVEGNPWIFREMNHYFATGEELARPSLAEVKAMILKHARAQIEMKGEFIGIREMRKHVAWYTAGMPHSAGLRRESNNIESYADLEKLLERL